MVSLGEGVTVKPTLTGRSGMFVAHGAYNLNPRRLEKCTLGAKGAEQTLIHAQHAYVLHKSFLTC